MGPADKVLLLLTCSRCTTAVAAGITGYPRWPNFEWTGSISVDTIAWACINLVVNGISCGVMLWDERPIRFDCEDDEQMWRFFNRRSGMGRLEMKQVGAAWAGVVGGSGTPLGGAGGHTNDSATVSCCAQFPAPFPRTPAPLSPAADPPSPHVSPPGVLHAGAAPRALAALRARRGRREPRAQHAALLPAGGGSDAL